MVMRYAKTLCVVLALMASFGPPKAAQAASEAYYLSLEDQRADLINARKFLGIRFVAEALENPAAAAHALTSMGSIASLFTESLTDNQRVILGSIGAALAIGCVFDSDCRQSAAGLLELASDAVDIEAKLRRINQQVGHRLLVRNSCSHEIRLAVRYQDLDGRSHSLAWWSFAPDGVAFLMNNDSYLRSQSGNILYYAETTSTRYQTARWTGNQHILVGGQQYQGRALSVQAEDGDAYRITLNCPDFTDRPNGGGSTLGVAVADFSLPPLVPDNWQTMTGAEAQRFNALLRNELQRLDLPVGTFLQARSRPLPFYDGGQLVEVETRHTNGVSGIYTAIKHPQGITVLTGKSDVIHALNRRIPVRLDNAQKAEDYLRFFAGSITGDLGPFSIVESAGEIIWTRQAILRDHRRASEIIEPVRMGRKGRLWTASATVKYGDTLFAANFEIQPGGMVRMIDDTVLASDLPISKEYFRNATRIAER